MPTQEEIEAATRAVHKEMLNSATTTETIARSALAAAENFIIERCAQASTRGFVQMTDAPDTLPPGPWRVSSNDDCFVIADNAKPPPKVIVIADCYSPAVASAIAEREREIERLQAQLDTLGQINREQAAAIKKITSHEFVETEFSKLRARVAELEAELAATERTLNAWIVRAKELEQTYAHPSSV